MRAPALGVRSGAAGGTLLTSLLPKALARWPVPPATAFGGVEIRAASPSLCCLRPLFPSTLCSQARFGNANGPSIVLFLTAHELHPCPRMPSAYVSCNFSCRRRFGSTQGLNSSLGSTASWAEGLQAPAEALGICWLCQPSVPAVSREGGRPSAVPPACRGLGAGERGLCRGLRVMGTFGGVHGGARLRRTAPSAAPLPRVGELGHAHVVRRAVWTESLDACCFEKFYK